MIRPISRRSALRNIAAGSLSAAPFLRGFAAGPSDAAGTMPKRFVFIVRSNGILTNEIQPQGLEDLVKVRTNGGWQSKLHDKSLAGMKLSPGMKALEPFKNKVNVFQGLSGRMCSGAHNAYFGALGACKSAGEAPPTGPTVDGILAAGLESPFPHIGFAMAKFGKQVVYPPLSAVGAKKPLPYYADPIAAYGDMFGSVVRNDKLKAAVQADKKLLDFMSRDVAKFQKNLPKEEKAKLDHYLDGFEALQIRSRKLAAMEAQLRAAAPELRPIYESEVETERLEAHFELAASSLIGGLTKVVSIQAEHLEMRLTGLGLGSKTVHQIGHMIEGKGGGSGGGAFDDGKGEYATRAVVMNYHMEQIAGLANKLQSVPEGNGTMLDNTVIVYMSDHGDRHHSKFYEWPMVTVGNLDGAFKAGRYIQVPGYGSAGHRTIAHLYKSLLHGAGLPQDTFGQLDLSMPSSISQSGPLPEWMA